jgi:hypothetical protein
VGNKKEKTCFNMRINKIFGGEDGENLGEGKNLDAKPNKVKFFVRLAVNLTSVVP